jgi:tetratricopeptide (TPR) repeat protein
MKIIIIIALSFSLQIVKAQTIEDYHRKGDFERIVKFEKDTAKLTGEQLYILGYSFFQLEKDAKALEMYDKAIAKGLNEGYIHFYKALALKYQEKTNEALKELEEAIRHEPNNQEYASELGLIYYLQGDQDKALEIYRNAQKMPNTYQSPYYMVGHIHHIKQDFDTALKEFYKGLDSLTEDNEFYAKTLIDIGLLEYTHTKNCKKSAEMYAKVVKLHPENYELYPKLMKSYNAAEQFDDADKIFDLMKTAFINKELPEDYMKFKTVAIDEFEWNGQKLTIYKSLVEPKKPLDISYKIYLINKEGGKIERTFMTEQTISLGADSPKHLLCEKERSGTHHTYPYGWAEDKIPLKDIKKAVLLVLEEKMKPQASSNFGKN